MNRNDALNAQYHRSKVSKRCAVKCLIDIADIVMPYGHISLYSGGDRGTYDYGLYNMVDEIRRLKLNASKYNKLQNILVETIK